MNIMNEKNELDYQLYIQREDEFYHEPESNENAVHRLIINGDTEQILENKRKYGNNPKQSKGTLSDNPLRNQIYHLVVNAALITRACVAAGMPSEAAYTLSDMYIRKADKCQSVNAVMELNDEMVIDYAGRMRALRKSKRLSPAVRKTVDYIITNLGQKLTAEKIADTLGYNRSYLHTLFKEEMNTGIHEYITAKRIDTAKSMLRSSGIPIARISQALGFSSQSHFCKVFKEITGTTPKKYRDD